MEPSTPLELLAPDYGRLDAIWQHPLPFALWPVGSKSLLAHWMDEAVRRHAAKVVIYAPDRPAEIRRHLEGGHYWSKEVEIIPISRESASGEKAIRLDGLPGCPMREPIRNPENLLRRWLELQEQWLEARQPREVSIDVERVPQGWLGPGVIVHPSADLRPPYWIGARTLVGAGCRIGPCAVIHPGCLLDTRVEVERAVVLPDTYVGRNTRLHEAAAQGSMLIDIKRACRVEIPESFILSGRHLIEDKPSWAVRAFALAAWVLLAPLALLWPRQSWEEQGCILGRKSAPLSTGRKGPLLLRRWPWLRAIAAGNLRWLGPLPRTESQVDALPGDLAQRIAEHLPGLFSWADSQGCYSPDQEDEWIHAAFQLHDEGSVNRLLRRQIVRLAMTVPPVAP
jgi:hypothetical protein